MRRIVPFIIAAMLVALVPGVAAAQEFEAELEALGSAVEGLAGETAEEWGESAAAVDEALAALKGVAADLDYAEFDAAVAALAAAIEGGDLAEIEAAAEPFAAAFAALEAQAAEGGDGTEQPTTVETGSGVDQGPNTGLLVVSALLALLAVGAWLIRPSATRR